jgi:hypothetical protein
MIPEINTRLIAVRSKLRRSIVLKANIMYEVYISLLIASVVQNFLVFPERPLACRALPEYPKSSTVRISTPFVPMILIC